MSNNAVEAYDNYRMPATVMKKFLGVRDLDIWPCEAHHTSKMFNLTQFYDARDVIRKGTIRRHSVKRPNPVQLFARLLVCCEIVREEGYEVRAATKARLEARRAGAKEYYRKLRRRREARRAAKAIAAAKAEEEHREAAKLEKAKSQEARCVALCAEHKIRANMITRAYSGEGQEDPHCMLSQIRRWFDGMSLKQALALCEA